MDRLDLGAQGQIGPRPRRRPPATPRREAAGEEAQDPAHRSDPVEGLMRAHALEPFGGIDRLACANQTAAFCRISRSSRNSRVS